MTQGCLNLNRVRLLADLTLVPSLFSVLDCASAASDLYGEMKLQLGLVGLKFYDSASFAPSCLHQVKSCAASWFCHMMRGSQEVLCTPQ